MLPSGGPPADGNFPILDERGYAGSPAQAKIKTLSEDYQAFDRRDCLMLPLLSDTDVKETGEIGIFRVSPADASLAPRSGDPGDPHDLPERKLAGVKLGHFGAFLSKDWRHNDIMWGRLDGAERIITALLPDPDDAPKRKQLVAKAQAEILKNELRADVLLAWLAQYVKSKVGPCASEAKLRSAVTSMVSNYGSDAAIVILRDLLGGGDGPKYCQFARQFYQMPSGPDPKTFLQWTGRAVTIFGDMLNGLKGGGTALAGVASKLKVVGIVLTQSVGLAIPKSFRNVLVRYWLGLMFAASLILIVIGPYLSPEAATVGWKVLALSVALAIVFRMLGNYLVEGSWWKRALKSVRLLIAVVICIVFAAGVRSIIQWVACHKEWFVNFLHKLLIPA